MKIITIIFLLFFYFKFNLSLDFFQKDLSQRFTSENSVVFPYCIELFCVRFSLRFQKLLYHIFYSRLNQERWNKCSVVELQQHQRKPVRLKGLILSFYREKRSFYNLQLTMSLAKSRCGVPIHRKPLHSGLYYNIRRMKRCSHFTFVPRMS